MEHQGHPGRARRVIGIRSTLRCCRCAPGAVSPSRSASGCKGIVLPKLLRSVLARLLFQIPHRIAGKLHPSSTGYLTKRVRFDSVWLHAPVILVRGAEVSATLHDAASASLFKQRRGLGIPPLVIQRFATFFLVPDTKALRRNRRVPNAKPISKAAGLGPVLNPKHQPLT